MVCKDDESWGCGWDSFLKGSLGAVGFLETVSPWDSRHNIYFSSLYSAWLTLEHSGHRLSLFSV